MKLKNIGLHPKFMIYKNKINYIFIFLITLFLINLFNYDIKFQHDAQLHNYPIFSIINFDFKNIDTPYGLIYYSYVSIFSVIAYPFYFFDILSPRESFYLMVRISNIILFVLSFFFSYRLSKAIFKNESFFLYLPTLLIFSLSSVQRSFFMVRPENLIFTVIIFASYYIYKFFNEQKLEKKHFWILAISLFIIGSQKFNGFVYVFIFFSFCLFFIKNNKIILKLAILVFSLIYIYYLCHYLISDSTVYDRPYNLNENLNKIGIFNLNKGLEIFYSFSFYESWLAPMRYSHSDSMLNTLFLDLFGDYYGYGVFNYLKNDGAMTKVFINCLHGLNRISLILSIIFFSVIAIFILNFIKIFRAENPNYIFFLFQIVQFLAGFLVLILVAINEHTGEQSTVFKWSYINFFLIQIIYPMNNFFIQISRDNALTKKILTSSIIVFIFIAQFQLMPFRC